MGLFKIFALIFLIHHHINGLRHGQPSDTWFLDGIFEKFSTSDDGTGESLKISDLNELMDTMGIKYFPHPEHMVLRDDDFLPCYTASQLGRIYGFDNVTLINKNKFKDVASALIMMSITDSCTVDDEHDHEGECKASVNNRLLYGSVTVIIISIISLITVVLVGKFGSLKGVFINCLTGLAFGTLISDTLLHLIPAALGLHDHSSEDPLHDHDHDHGGLRADAHNHDDAEDMTYVWILSVTLLTIVVLWFFELIFDSHGHNSHGHSHSNGVDQTVNVASEELQIEEEVPVKKSSFLASLKNVQARGWSMVFGDILHNVTDGLAIAASFTQSPSLGFSTGLAILVHEIPHEISAFIIMRKFGFSYGAAVVINALNGMASLITCLIVTSLTPEPSVWLFAITAGVFIHISLVDLLHDIKETFIESKKKKEWLTIFLITLFALIGWTLMLLLAIFEDDIEFDFNISC